DLCESNEIAGFVANCVNNHVCPEQRPVLAHSPSLGFKATGGGGYRERTVRGAIFFVLSRIELGEMPPDDFFRGVAFDACGARIPACYRPARIQHVQRVVGDARDERTALSVTLAQCCTRFLFCGYVTARDVDKTIV